MEKLLEMLEQDCTLSPEQLAASLGKDVEEIGVWAFNGCKNLICVTVRKSVKLGKDTFENCHPDLRIVSPSDD